MHGTLQVAIITPLAEKKIIAMIPACKVSTLIGIGE
jgi:hypothetical protein